MKKLILCLAFLIAATGVQAAQQYSATKDANKGDDYNHRFSSGTRPSPASRTPTPKAEKLEPAETGVIYEMTDQGFILIDPTAPPEMGMGEAFLTSNPFPAAGAATAANEASREFGGIELYGWDF